MEKELWSLAIQGIKGRKKSSLLMIFILFLSVAVAVITISISGSMEKTNEEYRYDTYGSWYGAIPDGMEEDREVLETGEWIDTLGTSNCYGQISSLAGTTGIGTVDDNFNKVGRITMLDGKLPEADNEIAMEANLLSALGYDYELGQEVEIPIEFRAGTEMVYSKQTYQLCGVIRAYSNLWTLSENSSGKLLNGAIVTEGAAAQLEEAAKLAAEEETRLSAEQAKEGEDPIIYVADPPSVSYYFTVKEGMGSKMQEELNQYLLESREGTGRDQAVCINTASYTSSYDTEYHYFYMLLIYIVTLLAVVCIYTIQIQKQVRQVALFRSIGITKSQLRRMLSYETICLCIPAAILGMIGGAVGTWGMLKLLVYAGSVAIQVHIPIKILGSLLLIWVVGILLVRQLVFLIALREPLTGRFSMGQCKVRRYRRWKWIEIVLLSSLLCGAAFFTILESLDDIHSMQMWQQEASYIIYSSQTMENFGDTKGLAQVSKEQLKQMQELPGMGHMKAYSTAFAKLEFEGIDECSYYQEYKASGVDDGDNLYAIPEENWNEFFDAKDLNLDVEAFRKGEQVIVTFPVEVNGKFAMWGDGTDETSKFYEDCGIVKGDSLSLTITGMEIIDDTVGENKDVKTVETTVGAIREIKNGELLGSQGVGNAPYTIFCSEQFLEKMMLEIEPGYVCSSYYLSGNELGYTLVHATADLTAGYLSTDYVLAALCEKAGVGLTNLREVYAAYVQEHLQTLILLYSSGGCIVLILFLIIGNAIVLETGTEKRKYGILQSIGMSKRQMKLEIWKKAGLTNTCAVVVGFAAYEGFLLATKWKYYKLTLPEVGFWQTLKDFFCGQQVYVLTNGGKSWTILVTVLVVWVLLFFLWRFAKRSLYRENLMDKMRNQQ